MIGVQLQSYAELSYMARREQIPLTRRPPSPSLIAELPLSLAKRPNRPVELLWTWLGVSGVLERFIECSLHSLDLQTGRKGQRAEGATIAETLGLQLMPQV